MARGIGTTLVLAGGGVAGIAWELGVLRGVADADPVLAERILGADVVIGTSAGASVGAQITSGVPLDELYERQLRPETAEIEVELNGEELFARLAAVIGDATDPVEVGRRIGALALAAGTVAPAVRLAAVDARLPVKHWPDRALVVVTVNARTGQPRLLDRDSGVDLLHAVAASGAVPGVWPAVTIGDEKYTDGGVRSIANADLAAGADRVLVIQPSPAGAAQPWGDPAAELAALAPAPVGVISADQASIDAFGTNALSPATRAPAARAGRAVGAASAAEVATLWN
jgi:NTE family protein